MYFQNVRPVIVMTRVTPNVCSVLVRVLSSTSSLIRLVNYFLIFIRDATVVVHKGNILWKNIIIFLFFFEKQHNPKIIFLLKKITT